MREGHLENEWAVLQHQFDDYETYSLFIKLANFGLLSAAYFSNNISFFILFLLLIAWVQDAIWKTFQSRIESRLLHIETCIINNTHEEAYQFNSQYQANRLTGIALINEYLRQAIRPTIAFPHILLIVITSSTLLFK